MRIIWTLLIILTGSLAGYVVTRFENSEPQIRARTGPVFVGESHSHVFDVSDEGAGIETIRVWVESAGVVHELIQRSYPGGLLTGAESKAPRHIEVTFQPRELGLPDGASSLKLEARDFSWRGNVSTVTVPLVIDTQPPRISLETGLTYVRRGGAELAVYRISEDHRVHGVQLGEQVFPGFAHPSDPTRYVAFYALPRDVAPDAIPRVFAEDRSGNRAEVSLSVELIERSFPADRIQLSEAFMRRKVAELLGESDQDLLSSYLKLNNEMRRANADRIREIVARSSPDRLWRGAFRQLPNSQVSARFAERRTYHYGGRDVDQQVHLGYDLASTSQAQVPAANDGVVIFAEPLGIYGNTVILDHGLGLFSLYGHLSRVNVEKGQAVSTGDPIGTTGSTGLAGGDHLHFAMLVGGVFVDPLEWMDERWLQEHVEPKLASSPPVGDR